jgi:aryl-alcohol dehydrogenase-like predicted oxidoreductase
VQVSLLDSRALRELATLCNSRGVGLLCYGALAGGFLHERWLGVSEPLDPLENRSLVKYKLIIDDVGGWALFQRLLQVLQQIATAHQTTIGALAIHYVLQQPTVAASIVGARSTAHLAPTLAAPSLTLSASEQAMLDAVLAERTGPVGDVYALEREKGGRHASIMRYNLNTT